VLYTACLLLPFAVDVALISARPLTALALLALPLAIAPVKAVRGGATGLPLVTTLRQTGRIQLVFGLLLAIGLAW
jgi:1,4-dihydroxy-2-naphthoate octaprenyltransferase